MNRQTNEQNSIHDTMDIFLKGIEGKTLVAGYGSLLSRYSRERYSNIDGIGMPVRVKGWERAWITRSLEEKQTYAGALANKHAQLNAVLIALDINPEFEKREQDYRFTKLDPSVLALDTSNDEYSPQPIHNLATENLRQALTRHPIYICESLRINTSTAEYPVHFSYIDTCLAGCHEIDAQHGPERFFAMTTGWQDGVFVDDTKKPNYPRYTPNKNNDWNIHVLLNKYRK